MKSVLSLGLKLFAIALLAGTMVASSFVAPQQASAATFDGYVSGALPNGAWRTMRNYSEAASYLNEYCSMRPAEVAVAAYPTNMSFNDSTGALSYLSNIVWRSCGSADTRAFAITGYPQAEPGSLATCPNAGSYAYPSTYDCIKYVGSDLGNMAGYAALGCPSGSGYACVTGGSNPSGLFRSVIERTDKQPPRSVSQSSQTMGGQVPNWPVVSGSSGSYPFQRTNAYCSYWKWNSNGVSAYGNCVQLSIKVTWTRNFDLRTSLGLSQTTADPGQNITINRQNVANGGDSAGSANWWLIRFTVPRGGTFPNASAGRDTNHEGARYNSSTTSVIASGSRSFGVGNTGLPNVINGVGSGEPGSRVCYALEVSPYSNTDPVRWYSDVQCVTINYKWSIAPKITAQVVSRVGANAQPGDTARWTHSIKNDGPTVTSGTIQYNARNSGTLGTGIIGSTRSATNLASGASTAGFTTDLRITQDHVGQTLCRVTSAVPGSSASASAVVSPQACISVPYNYTLTPGVTVNPDETVDPGTEITITPNITDGGPTKSRPTDWELTFVTVPPNVGVPGGNTNSTAPCSNYRPTSNINCRTIGSGNGVFNPGNNPLPISRETAPDVPVGTKLCFGLSVRPPSSSAATNIWLHSNLTCIIIAKSPLVQVRGGDLIVGRNTTGAEVRTNTKVTGGTHYGSWTEYGIIASGRIFGMASGAGYAGGVTGLAATPQCSVSQLTFANSTISGATAAPKCANDASSGATAGFGNYTLGGTAPSVASRFPVIAGVTPSLSITGSGAARKAVINPASLTSGNYQASGNFTLEMTGVVQAGKWLVINAPNSTVTVATDIRVNAGAALTNRSQIPQVVIIANNINIAGSVQQIDAWLLATGTGANGVLNTCTDAAKPHAGQCNNLLTVNGPIQANHLILNRTAGSGTGARSGDPAEVFNLRADAYLWATAAVPGNNRVPTVYTKELPPRF